MDMISKQNGVPSLSMLVWDSEDDAPIHDGTVVLWRNFCVEVSEAVVSVPSLVESNSVVLKKRYLDFVFNLGETCVHGRRLVDLFEIRSGFSYWWVTLIAEKCNFAKSPHIDQAIRLMALEDWFAGRRCKPVTLASSNEELAECMRAICVKLGLVFEWRPTTNVETRDSSLLRRVYRRLPRTFQALIWLWRYAFERFPLKGVGLRDWLQSTGETMFVSYLDNLVPTALSQGKFESGYWAHLPSAIERDGTKTNWLHLYVPDKLLPNAAAAANAISKFNQNLKGSQVHVTLDSFLSGKVIVRTILNFYRLGWRAFRLNPSKFFESADEVNLWPLFKREWSQSFFGPAAMQNILFLNLFEEAMSAMALQSVGSYLQENQGWEFAFNQSWRAAGHGRLIGSPHSTVRDWDLRYFFAPKTYDRTGVNDLPMPDYVAVNGRAARDAFIEAHYPALDLVEVEALRYLHLNPAHFTLGGSEILEKASVCFLVVSDYLPKKVFSQIQMLGVALQHLPFEPVIIVKPHPNCPVDPSEYPGIRFRVSDEPLSILLGKCHAVYASNMTSAAVDAYCAGVPVISTLDPNSLNLSPLRGREGVVFVTTPKELADALLTVRVSPHGAARCQDFFNLNSELSLWLKILRGQS